MTTDKTANAVSAIFESSKELNQNVVKAAEGIVSAVSPALAKTLVDVDANFKKLCWSVVQSYVGLLKGVVDGVSKTVGSQS